MPSYSYLLLLFYDIFSSLFLSSSPTSTHLPGFLTSRHHCHQYASNYNSKGKSSFAVVYFLLLSVICIRWALGFTNMHEFSSNTLMYQYIKSYSYFAEDWTDRLNTCRSFKQNDQEKQGEEERKLSHYHTPPTKSNDFSLGIKSLYKIQKLLAQTSGS